MSREESVQLNPHFGPHRCPLRHSHQSTAAMQTSVIRCQVPTAAAAQAKARVALPVAMVRPMKAVGAGLAALALTMSANAATIKVRR